MKHLQFGLEKWLAGYFAAKFNQITITYLYVMVLWRSFIWLHIECCLETAPRAAREIFRAFRCYILIAHLGEPKL